VAIRLARPEDARGVAEVRVTAWQVAYRGLLPEDLLNDLSVEGNEALWRDRLQDGSMHCLVDEEKGRVMGFVSCGAGRDEGAGGRGEGEVYALYVRPDQWRRGRGTALLNQAMRLLGEQGYDQVMLWVLCGNGPAQAFYRKMGFTTDPGEHVRHWRDGVRLHLARYRHSLQPEAWAESEDELSSRQGGFEA